MVCQRLFRCRLIYIGDMGFLLAASQWHSDHDLVWRISSMAVSAFFRGFHITSVLTHHRLPVTGLWLDVFQKIKALGFNTVSFYVHWGLVEHKRGSFDFNGHRSYKPFFEAARKVGIYLIARPGPYINAEVTGKGFKPKRCDRVD
jgi:hypothetical protein